MKELLTSKKFIVTISAMIVAVAAKKGLNLDSELVGMLVALVVAYLVGQGAADFGKAAAQIKADAPVPLPDKVQQTVNVAAPNTETKRDGPK